MILNNIFSVVGTYKPCPTSCPLHLCGFVLIHTRSWRASGLHGNSPSVPWINLCISASMMHRKCNVSSGGHTHPKSRGFHKKPSWTIEVKSYILKLAATLRMQMSYVFISLVTHGGLKSHRVPHTFTTCFHQILIILLGFHLWSQIFCFFFCSNGKAM